VAGVLALAPGERGHLRVTLADRTDREPHEPGSFDVGRQAALLAPGVRVALVRGAHDRLRRADLRIELAGGGRLRRFIVPFAGHSLRRLAIAGPVIDDAADWLVPPPN
jgi:hypothetical protein